MVIFCGEFKLKDATDIPVVRFRIAPEDGSLVAYIWTDDGELDKVAKALDDTLESFHQLDEAVNEVAAQWLLARDRRIPPPVY